MIKLPESYQNLKGRWQIENWENQHVFYEPDQDALQSIRDWLPLDMEKINDCPSNFIYSGIGEQNVLKIRSGEVLFQFTDLNEGNYFRFSILVNKEIIKKAYWQISAEQDYCDISIVMGEVYNYALCKIHKLTDNELILLERIDNTVSDTYFQKITLNRVEGKGNKSVLFG